MTYDIELIDVLTEQRDGVRDWLEAEAEYAIVEQAHLVESTPERAYWHHGYQAALDDVIRHIIASDPSRRSAGKPN